MKHLAASLAALAAILIIAQLTTAAPAAAPSIQSQEPGSSPWQWNHSYVLGRATSPATKTYNLDTPPSGYRLVITTFSVSCVCGGGAKVTFASVYGSLGASAAGAGGTIFTRNRVTATGQVFVNPGIQVLAQVGYLNPNDSQPAVALYASGYFVPTS